MFVPWLQLQVFHISSEATAYKSDEIGHLAAKWIFFFKCDFEEIGKCNAADFSVCTPEKWLLYWWLYWERGVAPETQRSEAFPGSTSLDTLFLGLNGQEPIMCLMFKRWNTDNWRALDIAFYFWVNHGIFDKFPKESLNNEFLLHLNVPVQV